MRQAVFIAAQRSLPGLISISPPSIPRARGLLHPPILPPALSCSRKILLIAPVSFSLLPAPPLSLSLTLLPESSSKLPRGCSAQRARGGGYPGHVGERGNSFNRLIILFKPVAPLVHPLLHPPPTLTPPLRSSPPACWLTLFARIMNSLEKGGEASTRNESRAREAERPFAPLSLSPSRRPPPPSPLPPVAPLSFSRQASTRFQLLQN